MMIRMTLPSLVSAALLAAAFSTGSPVFLMPALLIILLCLSSVIGGGDSFLSKNKAKSLDAKLARATKWIGAAFLVLTLVLLILG